MRRRYCLWGGRESADWVQIGSPEDRRLQITLRATAAIARLGIVMGQMLLPSTERATKAFQELGASIERSRLWWEEMR